MQVPQVRINKEYKSAADAIRGSVRINLESLNKEKPFEKKLLASFFFY